MKKVFVEIGLGNNTFISTEVEDGNSERRISKFIFLTPALVRHARKIYKELKIKDWNDGDWFFETFGPGNVDFIDRPYERFNDYELLLKTLINDDLNKYLEIHKGTPFYFLAWTAFGLKDYEKAIFYMDAAISEDQRKIANRPIGEWIKDPASQFLTLEEQGNQSARQITLQLRNSIKKELDRFNLFSGLSSITIESLVEKFVFVMAQNKNTRSIITAIYSFILEFTDRHEMLNLRSKDGGSIEPLLVHLFKGGLIFESLLKLLYTTIVTIGDLNNNKQFRNDFISSIDTEAVSLTDIINNIQNDDIQTAFNTTAKTRNTSGHNLVWDDIFNKPENYKKIYEQILNAIFYIIAKKFQ